MTDYRNWRRRRFDPAAAIAELDAHSSALVSAGSRFWSSSLPRAKRHSL